MNQNKKKKPDQNATNGRPSVVQDIVQELQSRIFRGDIPPGSLLPSERVLSTELNVARAPVREALSRLEQMRLIDVRQGQGSTVTNYRQAAGPEILQSLLQISQDEPLNLMQSILEVRVHVGGSLAELACAKACQKDTLTLREAYNAEKAPTDRNLVLQYDFTFFDTLAAISKNVVFALLLNTIRDLYLHNADLLGSLAPARQEIVCAHHNIIESIAQQDARQARNATMQYLAQGLQEPWRFDDDKN